MPARLAALLILSAGLTVTTIAVAQRAAHRATAGENVTVILNHVRADQRQQFEQFTEALRKAAQKGAATDPTLQRVYERVRMITPGKPRVDGSYTYIWIFDPEVEGDHYSYESILTSAFDPAEAKKYLAMNDQALLRPQEVFTGQQSNVW